MLAEILPSLQIFQNLPLDRYLHVLAEIFPWGADFPKSATGQLPKLPTCACRNSSPSLQIFQNLLLDKYLHVLTEIPPCSLQIFQNLPLDRYLSYLHVLAENPPCSLQIFQNLPLDRYLSCLHVLAEIPPPVCRFSIHLTEICATGQFSKIFYWTVTYNMCLQKFPPGVQIFQNLPLDSYLSYLHVLAEIPHQFADFPKSATGQL